MRFIHSRKTLTLAAAIAAIVQSPAEAQERTSRVEEVVVTANRIPVPARQIATSVSVITELDLESHGNLAVVDVLRQLPAIATSNNGGAGKSTSLRIRGEEGFRTLTIFDGIRLSDPSGTQVGPSLEHLLSSGIGRVEILRGPQGLSYGADAGGIVNISSRQAEEGLHVGGDFQGGRFGTRQYNLNAGAANERADVFVSVSDFETDGFNARTSDNVLRDDDGYANTTLHARGGVNVTERLRAELVYRNVEGESEYDGCFLGKTTHDCLGTLDMDAARAALSYTGTAFTHAVSYATTRSDRDNLADGVSTFPSAGELNRFEYLGSATELPGFDLVWGGDHEEALNNGKGRDNVGVYAEILSDFSESLHLTAGVRHDDNDDFGTNTSERLTAAYLVDVAGGATLKLKTSYGSGFRAPSPYEIQYNSTATQAPARGIVLQQETSEGFEYGVEWLGEDLHLEAVYFDQDVDNAIEFDLVNFSGYIQNVGISNSQGIELSGEYTVNEHWRLSANFTHNDTRQPNGLPRRRRPEQLANLGISFAALDRRLNLNAFYRSSRDSFDPPPAVKLDNFEVLDLSGSFALTDNVQLYGRLENALDEKYQEIIGYNTAGRAGYVGIRLAF